ncbi:MAG: thioredoxin family protein [Planctomycetia bacterium]|nr:thioredoxin family protein [Planctomycetia bacterium]
MRKNLAFPLVAVMVVALASGAALAAGKFNKVVGVGDVAPDWSDAAGIDGKKHSLTDYKDAKVVVEVFTCNKCPVAQAYEDRLVEIQRDYKAKGVTLVAINCNNVDADKLPAMKERAEKKGFNFDYLYDASQTSGRAYGAKVTPEVFVLDGKRKIVYQGLIDDSWMDPNGVKHAYLRDALDAVLAGRTPDVQETKAVGCGIAYE